MSISLFNIEDSLVFCDSNIGDGLVVLEDSASPNG